ncbi:MAG: hypothetical protein LBR78_02160 [Holosporales bacterium]|jgi:hypothetical protein|nr:hypothetical protein [Holosporales bacterium]
MKQLSYRYSMLLHVIIACSIAMINNSLASGFQLKRTRSWGSNMSQYGQGQTSVCLPQKPPLIISDTRSVEDFDGVHNAFEEWLCNEGSASSVIHLFDVDGVLFGQDTPVIPIKALSIIDEQSYPPYVREQFLNARKIPVDPRVNGYVSELIAAWRVVILLTACNPIRAAQREHDLRETGVDVDYLLELWGGLDFRFGNGYRFKGGVCYGGRDDKGSVLLALLSEFCRHESPVRSHIRTRKQAIPRDPFATRLEKIIAAINIPAKITVMFVDDDRPNIDAVALVCRNLYHFVGIHYTVQRARFAQYAQYAWLMEWYLTLLGLGENRLTLFQIYTLATVLPLSIPLGSQRTA